MTKMPSLRSKASRLFKRDGTSDRDSGSSQDPAPDEGGQVARPSMDEKKMQSKPPSDEFNTFACASDNEDSAISNITLSGTGSDRKRPLKKKSSLFSLFQRNKDEDVPPVPPLPPTLPHPFAGGHISMGENSALNTALSTMFDDHHRYPVFPPAPSHPPPPPPSHPIGSQTSPPSPNTVTPGTSHARRPSAPAVPTAPTAAPMTPNTFATFRFAPSPSPSPLKLEASGLGNPPARPHRPSNSIVKSSLYVSALFSGMPLSPEADQLTFKHQDTDADHGSRPVTAHPALPTNNTTAVTGQSSTPYKNKNSTSSSSSAGSTRSVPRITSLIDINLPAALADIKNLPGEVTPAASPEPLSALMRYSSSTTSGSHYSQTSLRGRARIPSVQQAQAARRTVSQGKSMTSPPPPPPPTVDLKLSLRKSRSTLARSASLAARSREADTRSVFLPADCVQVHPLHIQTQIQTQPQEQNGKQPQGLQHHNHNEIQRPHTAHPPSHLPTRISDPFSTAIGTSLSRYSAKRAGLAIPMGPVHYPRSDEIPMEQYDPERGEFEFVRRCAGRDGRSPGQLWRDGQGYLHWVADI